MTDEEWPDVVKEMTAKFGSDPNSVGVLLEFLTVLPEEVTMNQRIPVDVSSRSVESCRDALKANDDVCNFAQELHFNIRVRSLLGSNVDEILRLLTMYIQAPGEWLR